MKANKHGRGQGPKPAPALLHTQDGVHHVVLLGASPQEVTLASNQPFDEDWKGILEIEADSPLPDLPRISVGHVVESREGCREEDQGNYRYFIRFRLTGNQGR